MTDQPAHNRDDREDAIEALSRRLGRLDPRQVAIWRAMGPVGRLELAFQAYQAALDAALAV
jgi:hypothetical protein